jgi:hypothetical protein
MKRILSTIYFLTGFLVILAAIWQITRLGNGWDIVGKSFALAKRLLGGISNPEDLSVIAEKLLPLLIALLLGVVLILLAADMKKSKPTLPKLGWLCSLFLIALIGVQVVEALLFLKIEALIFAFLLAYVLAFHFNYAKIHQLDGAIPNQGRRRFVAGIYTTSLAILGLLLIVNFVLLFWLRSQFPGYQIEYF